jgi:hypothetical protein
MTKANELDIPETATLVDVIRAINADMQWRRSAPERTERNILDAMQEVATRKQTR